MSELIPEPYELVLLTLGGFRLVRLIGWDSITERPRTWLTGEADDGEPASLDPIVHGRAREYVSTLIRCPWCQGFYVMLGIYGLWLAFPPAVIAVCVPLTLSTLVGLIAKNLDE